MIGLVVGSTIVMIGLLSWFFGYCLSKFGNKSVRTPPILDGIGNEDTKNLVAGMIGVFLGWFLIRVGWVFTGIGSVVIVVSWFVS